MKLYIHTPCGSIARCPARKPFWGDEKLPKPLLKDWIWAGPYFLEPHVGRGLAWADYDNDGLPDLAFSHNGGPVVLLRNRTRTANHWIRLELEGDGQRSNRNAIGARVEIEAGGTRQVHFVNGGGSYLSASERRLLIGLGALDQVGRATVTWPSGRRQVFENLAGDCWWRLHEGRERPEKVVP